MTRVRLTSPPNPRWPPIKVWEMMTLSPYFTIWVGGVKWLLGVGEDHRPAEVLGLQAQGIDLRGGVLTSWGVALEGVMWWGAGTWAWADAAHLWRAHLETDGACFLIKSVVFEVRRQDGFVRFLSEGPVGTVCGQEQRGRVHRVFKQQLRLPLFAGGVTVLREGGAVGHGPCV